MLASGLMTMSNARPALAMIRTAAEGMHNRKQIMADNKPPGNKAGEDAPLTIENTPRVAILTQYVKDLSFENPNAPGMLAASGEQPKINLAVNVQARRINEQQYEAEIKINVEARQADRLVFMIELLYGGIFQLNNIPAENLQPVLLIECPRLIFPFARRIIADATRDGGYAPLMIDPIDFAALYRSQAAAAQAKAAAAATANKTLN